MSFSGKVLVDTNIWIDHRRDAIPVLADRLEVGAVLMHPWVIGEIALGNLPNRDRAGILADLAGLPAIGPIEHAAAIDLLEKHNLMGRGIGYVDLNLLGSVLANPGARLWTNDRSLRTVAKELKVAYPAASSTGTA